MADSSNSISSSVSKAMRVKDAAAYLGIGKSTFWRWVQQGRLPKGIRLSARATVWRLADLEKFMAEQEGAYAAPDEFTGNREGLHAE